MTEPKSQERNWAMDNDLVESERGNGSHAAKKPPSVISGQLRDELIRILRTGDAKNEGAFTIAIAAQVEKFAVAAREILMTENLSQNDLSSLMRMRKQHFGVPYNLVGGSEFGPETGLPLMGVNNENFGVQAIRQVVDAVRTMGDSPAKLVEALAVARSNNLPDVAAVLEKKLGMSKADPVSEDATPESTFASMIPTLPDGRPLQ
jgi:hypothetical protein